MRIHDTHNKIINSLLRKIPFSDLYYFCKEYRIVILGENYDTIIARSYNVENLILKLRNYLKGL